MAKVGWDNEEVWGVSQVLAEQFSVLNLLILTQGTHKHGDNAKFIFAATQKKESITLITALEKKAEFSHFNSTQKRQNYDKLQPGVMQRG